MCVLVASTTHPFVRLARRAVYLNALLGFLVVARSAAAAAPTATHTHHHHCC